MAANAKQFSFAEIKSVSLTVSTASHSGDQHATVAIYFESLEASRDELRIKQVYSLGTSGTPVPDCDKLHERTQLNITALRYTMAFAGKTTAWSLVQEL